MLEPLFTRLPNAWEVEDVGRLLSRLYKKKVVMVRDDTVRWMEGKNGAFSVKSIYKALEIRPPLSFLVKMVWGSCVQPNLHFFFLGEATWGKSLNHDQL